MDFEPKPDAPNAGAVDVCPNPDEPNGDEVVVNVLASLPPPNPEEPNAEVPNADRSDPPAKPKPVEPNFEGVFTFPKAPKPFAGAIEVEGEDEGVCPKAEMDCG